MQAVDRDSDAAGHIPGKKLLTKSPAVGTAAPLNIYNQAARTKHR